MRIRVLATDDVIIKDVPYDDSWIIMEHLHNIGAKARSGSVPVHCHTLPGLVTIVYASADGAAKRYRRMVQP